ncbi:efflux RND transporter permease subunit [candidate division KSB1 bacterium]
MFLVKISVKRPVLATMIIMTFVILGLYAFLGLGIELMPEIEFPFVTVQTIYIGAGPVEIENLITKKIEEQVSAINGVKTISSTSVEGVSIVAIEFEVGVEVDIAALDVKDKVEIVKPDLPDDAFDPIVLKFDMGARPVMNLAVSGDRPLNEIYEITDDMIRPELMKIQGLASVDIIGGKIREIKVRLKREIMRSQNIGVMDVIMALSTENLNIPSGHITEERREFNIRVDGEFKSVDDLYDVNITPQNSGPIRLRDVAYIVDDFEEQRLFSRFNSNSSVGVSLIKRSDANIVEVVDDVLENLDRIKAVIPQDIQIQIASDESTFIRQSISEVVNNIGIGIILTGLILFLFLHSWQGTVIAALSMPTSIIATFILVSSAGFTLNFMTLLGLAVTVGVLVTNSIVVLENIMRFTKIEKDMDEAAIKGTTEIAKAVVASTLTNIVVFTPIAFMGGIIGQFFYQFGLTVAFATTFSLLVAFTLTPMLAAKLLKKKEELTHGFDLFVLSLTTFLAGAASVAFFVFLGMQLSNLIGSIGTILGLLAGFGIAGILGKLIFKPTFAQLRSNIFYVLWYYIIKSVLYILITVIAFLIFRYLFGQIPAVVITIVFGLIIIVNLKNNFLVGFGKAWDRVYDKLALDYKSGLSWALNHQGTFVLIILAVFTVSTSLFKYVGSEFMPATDSGYIEISIELPPGSNLDQTDRVLFSIESIFEKIPEIESFYTVVGQSPGTFIGVNQGIQYGQIIIKLVPMDDRTIETQDLVEQLKPDLAKIPIADIAIQMTQSMGGGGGSDLQIEITGEDIDKLNNIGEEVLNIAKSIPGAVDIKSSSREGVPEIRLRPNRKKMADYGISLATLAGVMRANIDGNVASKYRIGNKEYDIRVQLDRSYIEYAEQIKDIVIKVKDNYIPITELAHIEETEGPTSVLRKNKKRMIIISGNVANRNIGDVTADINAETDKIELDPGYEINFGGQAEIMMESFIELLKTLILAIILAFIVLAAIMESYIHPFIIMMTLPLAMIGVVLSLVITGKAISIISLMAVVMLVGIVVNNGILLVEYIQQLREEGKELFEAIVEASSVRLRPIIMTNLATAISMLPLALELGEGAEFRSPMAIVSIGALITSTIFTLFLIPILYNIIETVKNKVNSK